MGEDKETPTEKADRISWGRAVMAPFFGLAVLLAHQGVFFNWDWDAVNFIAMGVWTLLALIVLVITLTGGVWLMPRGVRRIADDDISRANRDRAIRLGFIAAMVVGMLVFVVAPFEPLSAQRAAHLIVSFGLAMALLTFGLAELHSLG